MNRPRRNLNASGRAGYSLALVAFREMDIILKTSVGTYCECPRCRICVEKSRNLSSPSRMATAAEYFAIFPPIFNILAILATVPTEVFRFNLHATHMPKKLPAFFWPLSGLVCLMWAGAGKFNPDFRLKWIARAANLPKKMKFSATASVRITICSRVNPGSKDKNTMRSTTPPNK